MTAKAEPTTSEALALEWQEALKSFRGKKGRTVYYLEPQGDAVERGVITHVGVKYIDVKYAGQDKPIATCPLNLQLTRTIGH